MQFGFMKANGTTDAIFMARQMQENFRVKGKKLYFGFVDLEKAFDRVLREVISWAMHKLGVKEWLVSAVMSMYTGAKTVARTVYGNSKGFEVKVGIHQGSASTRRRRCTHARARARACTCACVLMLNLGVYPLLPQNLCYYHKLFWRLFLRLCT